MPRQWPFSVVFDAKRVGYSLLLRPREVYYYVRFRGPDGLMIERSIGTSKKSDLHVRALEVIQAEFKPSDYTPDFVDWTEARKRLQEKIRQCGLRENTVKDYEKVIRAFLRVCPGSIGPVAVTAQTAERFMQDYAASKQRYQQTDKPKSPRTIASVLNKLNVLWSRWFIKELSIVAVNPWEDISPPKLDKITPRILTIEEIQEFFVWLTARWDGWRLPVLLFTVKGMIGCRLGELCSVKSKELSEGRILFPADETKSRKARRAKLPAELFSELQVLGQGRTYLWESFAEYLRDFYLRHKRPGSAAKVQQFHPEHLYWWLEEQVSQYRKAFPERRSFKIHDFRRHAMTQAYMAGIDLDRLAIALGCNPDTVRKHYLSLAEVVDADSVFDAIQGQTKGSENGKKKSEEG